MTTEIEELYQEVILDHSRRPRNFGELPDAAVRVHGDNPACGDEIHLAVKFDADGGLEDIKFTGRGCAISQASASMLTEMIEGRTVEEIIQLGKDDILETLGIPISPARTKCAFLPLRVLHRGLALAGLEKPKAEEDD